jgi:hypothetical protein
VDQLEYVLTFAVLGLPLIVAARALWRVLLYHYSLHALVIDVPFL